RAQAAPDDLREVGGGAIQQHLALEDAVDLQQVDDEPAEIDGLPADELARPYGRLVARVDVLQHVHRARDGGQRIAQLVAEPGRSRRPRPRSAPPAGTAASAGGGPADAARRWWW